MEYLHVVVDDKSSLKLILGLLQNVNKCVEDFTFEMLVI